MAKINISIDTDEDSMSVDVNGETLSNVTSVCVDTYDDSPSISITQVEKNDDITKYMVTRASTNANKTIYESEKAKSARTAEETIAQYVVAQRQKKVEKNKNF